MIIQCKENESTRKSFEGNLCSSVWMHRQSSETEWSYCSQEENHSGQTSPIRTRSWQDDGWWSYFNSETYQGKHCILLFAISNHKLMMDFKSNWTNWKHNPWSLRINIKTTKTLEWSITWRIGSKTTKTG